MRTAKFQTVVAVFAALVLIAAFYASPKAQAEDPKKPDRADLTMELGRADREVYLLQWAEARRDISLLAAVMRANPERFDAKAHALLDECGKLWVRANHSYHRASQFFLDERFPANDQQVSEFRAAIQELADTGRSLSHAKLDELLRAASDAKWTQWETDVDKEDTAKNNNECK